MSESEKCRVYEQVRQNESGNTIPFRYAETLGKTQNVSGKNKTRYHPILNMLHKQQGLTRCLDRTIIAVIEYQGKIYIGTNGIKDKPTECPRNGYTINQGYELCTRICKQPYHAEQSAIAQWINDCGKHIVNTNHDATIYVYGAKSMCERCKELCRRYKLNVIKVTPNLKEFFEHGKND